MYENLLIKSQLKMEVLEKLVYFLEELQDLEAGFETISSKEDILLLIKVKIRELNLVDYPEWSYDNEETENV